MAIPQGIKKLKYLLDMNQRQLAVALDIDPSLLNLYMNNKRKPGSVTLQKIIRLIKEHNLDMSIEEFLL